MSSTASNGDTDKSDETADAPSGDPASPRDRTCTHHADAPAIAHCADCGAPVCGACHGRDDRGFAQCPDCRDAPVATVHPWEKRAVDFSPKAFAQTLWATIRHPQTFFEGISERGSALPAAIFGFLTMTIGLLVGRAIQLSLVPDGGSLAELAADQGITEAQARVALLAGTPVIAAISAVIHTVALRIAVSVAGADTDWTTCMRIAGYSFGAYALMLVPPLGGLPIGRFLALIWLFNLESNALVRFFDFGRIKATFVVLLPILLSVMFGG